MAGCYLFQTGAKEKKNKILPKEEKPSVPFFKFFFSCKIAKPFIAAIPPFQFGSASCVLVFFLS